LAAQPNQWKPHKFSRKQKTLKPPNYPLIPTTATTFNFWITSKINQKFCRYQQFIIMEMLKSGKIRQNVQIQTAQ